MRLVSSRTAYLLGLPKPVRVAYLMASLPSTVRTVITKGKIRKQLLEAISEVRGRSTTGPHADALSLLLDGTEVGGSMPDEFLADNMMSLLLAAHDTTSNVLAWAIWETIQREDLQQHLAHEGSGLSDDPQASESWINAAHWTDAVVREALRMYPSAWIQPRRALAPFRLRNYLFPTGTTFSVSQWVTHRDARWFPDPHRFRPERWMEEREATTSGGLDGKEAPAERPQFAYFPFGGGKRFCIGKAIFEYEASILVGSFFRRWRAEPIEGCQPRPLFNVTMQPDRPMRVRLRRR